LPSQLVLPLASQPSLGRADFLVGPGNAQAVAFIDSWPHWPVSVAVLHGPTGCGKTHLVSVWQSVSGARAIPAAELALLPPGKGPLAIENVDAVPAREARDARLFELIEGASPDAPVLLTGVEVPSAWPTVIPDLASRFSAALSLPLWQPDDEFLAGLARKLLDDRQVSVPPPVVLRIVQSLERTPGAIREFIAKADSRALSEARPISLSLVRELIAEENAGLS